MNGCKDTGSSAEALEVSSPLSLTAAGLKAEAAGPGCTASTLRMKAT